MSGKWKRVDRILQRDLPCVLDECEGLRVAKGYCDKHYRRWKKHGDPNKVETIIGDDLARFWSHVDIGTDGHWLWRAAVNEKGYGTWRLRGATTLVHRFSYEHFVGKIPNGLQIDHLCRTPSCVNPDHLEPVTHDENQRRGKNGVLRVEKVECKHGHSLSGDNLYVFKDGSRGCKECRRRASREYERRKRIGTQAIGGQNV